MSLDLFLRTGAPPRPRARGRRDRGSIARLPGAIARQFVYEHLVLARRGVRFRSRDEQTVCDAYAAMSTDEFEAINARQSWANWRTIPRNLRGRLPRPPLVAVDLCCGAGDSTEVLAACLPAGSWILGLDASPALVQAATGRRYVGADGSACRIAFRTQSVLETFRRPDGRPIGEGEVDLVNSVGAVGSHFDASATKLLMIEVRRVLRPEGIALIDAGPGGTSPRELEGIVETLGLEVCDRARSCALDRYWQYCLREAARVTRART